jgi:hypothetical protein
MTNTEACMPAFSLRTYNSQKWTLTRTHALSDALTRLLADEHSHMLIVNRRRLLTLTYFKVVGPLSAPNW